MKEIDRGRKYKKKMKRKRSIAFQSGGQFGDRKKNIGQNWTATGVLL